MTKLRCQQVDIGETCIECKKSVKWGTGLYVNRLPADNDKYIGYLCKDIYQYINQLAYEIQNKLYPMEND